MNVHRVPPTQGLQWMREAVNIGARNPRAVFGAAALFVATLYFIAVLAVLPVALGLQGEDELSVRQAVGAVIPLFLVLTFIMPILLAGLMHVVREAEAGRVVRARDLFAPFGQGRAGSLAALGLVQIALNIAGGLLVIALAGSDYWPEYFSAVQGAMSGHTVTPPQPEHPVLMLMVQLVFNYFSYALMLLCVPLLAFSRLGIVEALKLGLRAAVVNIGANLLASMLFVIGLLLAALVIGMIATVAGIVVGLLHPALGAAVSMIVYGLFAIAVLVVLVSVSYVAWRDTFQPPDAAPPSSDAAMHHIEA